MVEKIGKYEIRATPGEGAMGIVHEAFDPDVERRVAIEVIGNHVNLAARLQGIAGPNPPVLDTATRDALPDWHDRLLLRLVELKGFSSRLGVYQFDLDADGVAAAG